MSSTLNIQATQLRAPQSNPAHQKGWMPNKTFFTAPRKGWITKTDSSHYSTLQDKSFVLGKTAEAITVHCQSLSANLVDTLVRSNLDWISLLSSDWQSEISNLSLPSANHFKGNWNTKSLAIDDLVQLTQQEKYYSAILFKKKYWIYTCCPYLTELGKVRLVVCFRDNESQEKYAALMTNRLDWSPSNIISQCIETHAWQELLEPNSISVRQ